MTNTRLVNNFFLAVIHDHIISYPTPKNLSYHWSFGALSGICLIIQILSGLFLSMHYVPDINLAFASVEHIMRDVNNGWLVRYIHSNGASMFFFVIFFHIFRNIYFGSYLYPRIQLWISGIVIFFFTNGYCFYGLCIALGSNEFLGCYCNY